MSSTSAGFQAVTMWRRLLGLVFGCLDHLGDLVDHPAVRRGPGAPLLAVDRAELAAASAHSSQMLTPRSCSQRTLVSPRRNQSSSRTIDLICSFLVVSSGKPCGQVEADLAAEHAQRAGAGAVALRRTPLARMSASRSRYCRSAYRLVAAWRSRGCSRVFCLR